MARLRVLVVDDSAVARQIISAVLGEDPGIEVAVAADAVIAEQKIRRAKPDVVVLDLELPRVDGLTFLRRLMEENPLPVVVCSGTAGPGTTAAVEALARGAVEIVSRPRVDLPTFFAESGERLREAVRAAASARVGRMRRVDAPAPRATPVPLAPSHGPAAQIIAVGGSTGGPEALQLLLEGLPADAPPVIAVLHMPAPFPEAYARRLDSLCAIDVRQAEDGEPLRPGLALVAPGDRHAVISMGSSGYCVRLFDGPPVGRHRPSVDVLLGSVATVAGARAVGVLLSGMGSDGAEGLLAMHRAGAHTLAQDEASCIVFGMPREAIALGAVDRILPSARLAEAALRACARTAAR